jgi:hypothetical protein
MCVVVRLVVMWIVVALDVGDFIFACHGRCLVTDAVPGDRCTVTEWRRAVDVMKEKQMSYVHGR